MISKIFKNSVYLNQFLVTLYDCILNLKHPLSTDKLLKNGNVSQLGTDKSLTTALYSETTKPENFSWFNKDYKKNKIKQVHPFKNYSQVSNVEILDFLIQNFNWKILNLRLKTR